MSSLTLKNGVLGGIAVLLLVCIVYQYDSTLFGVLGRSYDGFADAASPATAGPGMAAGAAVPVAAKQGAMNPTPAGKAVTAKAATVKSAGAKAVAAPAAAPAAVAAPAAAAVTGFKNGKEGFADLASMEGPAAFASAEAPAGCYPRDQLTPTELLPADQNTIYAQQNPMGVGSLKGKNFLSAGALIGVNTVGQSLRNANLQLRSEPPNPQVPVSIFLQSTIGPDISHRPLEVGS